MLTIWVRSKATKSGGESTCVGLDMKAIGCVPGHVVLLAGIWHGLREATYPPGDKDGGVGMEILRGKS